MNETLTVSYTNHPGNALRQKVVCCLFFFSFFSFSSFSDQAICSTKVHFASS